MIRCTCVTESAQSWLISPVFRSATMSKPESLKWETSVILLQDTHYWLHTSTTYIGFQFIVIVVQLCMEWCCEEIHQVTHILTFK